MLTKQNVANYLDGRVQEIFSELPKHLRISKCYVVGKLYYKIKEYDMAIAFLRHYLGEKDDDAMAHELIGNCYRRSKPSDVRKALSHYMRAIELDSQQPTGIPTECKQKDLSQDMVNSANSAKHWLFLRKQLLTFEGQLTKMQQLQESQAGSMKAMGDHLKSLESRMETISARQAELFDIVQDQVPPTGPTGGTNPFTNNPSPAAGSAPEEQVSDLLYDEKAELYCLAGGQWWKRLGSGLSVVQILRHMAGTLELHVLVKEEEEEGSQVCHKHVLSGLVFKPMGDLSWIFVTIDGSQQQQQQKVLEQFKLSFQSEDAALEFISAVKKALGAEEEQEQKQDSDDNFDGQAVQLAKTVTTTLAENMIQMFGRKVDLFRHHIDTKLWKWHGPGVLSMLQVAARPGSLRLFMRRESGELMVLMSVTRLTNIQLLKNPRNTLLFGGMGNVATDGVMERVAFRFSNEEHALEFLAKIKNRLQTGTA